jgi:hypothetical protein
MVRNADDKTKDRTILGKSLIEEEILLAAMKKLSDELGALLVSVTDGEITVVNPEKQPVNTKELGALTADDVKHAWNVTIYESEPPFQSELKPADIMLMFDKDPDTYHALTAPDPGQGEVAKVLLFHLKTPFDVKRLKILNPDGQYIMLGEDLYVVTFTPDPRSEGVVWSDQPMKIDDEIYSIMICNTGASEIDIAEIIGTIYHPVEVFPQDPEGLPIKSPPESQPINVQEMPELIPESIREIEIYPYAELVGFLEKELPMALEHIGFLQKELIQVEEYVGFIEKEYVERFMGYSAKPTTVFPRYMGYSTKPLTVHPRFMGYSTKPVTIIPRYMGYSAKPTTAPESRFIGYGETLQEPVIPPRFIGYGETPEAGPEMMWHGETEVLT